MGLHSVQKKQLSAEGMLATVRSIFSKIPEPQRDTRGLKSNIPLLDCLMSGLAVFGIKFPSLLQFDQGLDDKAVKNNLKTLYRGNCAPSDTYMQERLDQVGPDHLRQAFASIVSPVQRR